MENRRDLKFCIYRFYDADVKITPEITSASNKIKL